MRYIWPLALAALCVAGPVSASTLTLSTGGSDANDGVSAPVRSLQAAVALLEDGDTLQIQPGTYTAGVFIDIPNVTIHGQGEVILDGTNAPLNNGVHIGQTSGVTVENVKVRNCRGFGFMVGEASGVTIRNCEATANGSTGIISGHSSDLTIQGCVAANNKREHGIYCSESGDRLKIIGNLVYGNPAAGLQVNATQDAPIPTDTNQDGFSTDCLIANNTLHDNCTQGGYSINLAGLLNSTVVNNLIYNEPSGGIALWDDGMGTQFSCRNNRLLHNTVVVSAAKSQVGVQFTSGCTGNQLFNNIISVQNGTAVETEEPIESNFNLFQGPGIVNDDDLAAWRNQSGNDQNSQVADPRLGADYHPLSGSPAIDGGRQIYPTDKDGAPRPQGANPDLGCYETGGSAPPPPPPPGAPSGLTAAAGSARVDLRWNAVTATDLRGYCVYRSTSQNGSFTALNATPTTSASYADTSVQNSATYWYRVCAVAGGQSGSPSNTVRATPTAPAPQTFVISGQVTVGSAGLSGVTVSAGSVSAVTAVDGTYRLAGLAAGSYTVTASVTGYTLSAPQKVTVGPDRGGINFTAQAIPPPSPAAVIYDDALAGGWSAGGSKASYSLSASTPVKQGTRSLSVSVTAKNGYLQLAGSSASGLAITGKSALKLCVHGGTTGGQPLQIRALVDGKLQSPVNLANYGGAPKANGWTEYSIPLSALRVTRGKLTGLRISATAVTKPAYLDYIRME